MTHAPMPKPSAGRSDGQGAGPRGAVPAAARAARVVRATAATGSPRSRRPARPSSDAAPCCWSPSAPWSRPPCSPTRLPRRPGLQGHGRRPRRHRHPLADAGCDPVQENAATGNQEHVAEGTKVEYAQSPPDSGKHYPSPASFTKHFYSTDDRPELETLVHNLEHGYTLAWYRADAPEDEIAALRQAAEHLRQRDLRPDAEVHRGALLHDGRRVPRGQGRRPRALDRRPGQPCRPDEAAGRPAELQPRQRPGHRRLHGEVPGRQLPRAQRRLVVAPPVQAARPAAARSGRSLAVLVPAGRVARRRRRRRCGRG